MNSIISINDLSYGYDEELIFKKFNLEIRKNSFVTIVGPSGSGKTTLMNLILDNNISNIKVQGNIGYLFYNDNSDKKVIEELMKNYKKEEIVNVGKQIKLENFLDKRTKDLTISDRQVISLIKILIEKPEIIILNSTLGFLNDITKMKILKELSNVKSTIIHVTNDIEDALIGNEIIIIKDGNLIIQDKPEVVLSKKEILFDAGVGNVFIAEMSERLKVYGLINEISYTRDELVNKLWK